MIRAGLSIKRPLYSHSTVHSDGSGTTLVHRNVAIEDYCPAIAEVTACGGWVLRLGDKSMKPLPRMANVVD